MKTSNRLLLLGMLSALASPAAAADNATAAGKGSVDTSEWKCEACKYEEGTTGSVDLGAGVVSDRSAKFGEYNGLNKKGGYFIGDGDARFRGKDGNYWNLNANNVGLDARSIDAEGGQQGRYKLLLKYDQIPHYLTNNSLTPFAGTGGASLTLPAGFPAATTALMPLATNLQQVDLGTERKRLGVGGSWFRSSEWEYAVNFRHESREGTKRSAGAFFVNASNLVEPVNYDTDQIDASASYTGGRLQAKFAYYGSSFRNASNSLTWQNPFIGPAGAGIPVAGSGQLALPPDNQFHQLQGSGGFQLTDRTRATADVAVGRMSQNEGFLGSTQTAGLGVGALPGTSLNGQADTLNANLKLTSAVTDKIRLNAAYAHNDRENHTPQGLYPSVATDMFVGQSRTNMPYSFKQEKLKLSAEYKATAKTRATIGFDDDSQKRTFQESDRTREATAWGKVSSVVMEKVDMSLKYAHGERKNQGYAAVVGVLPMENPLMRKYNMAGRKRDTAAARADFAALENLNIGFGVDASKDMYSESPVGLTSGSDYNVNGDVSLALTQKTSVHVFANRQVIKSKQLGSQGFAAADWTGENKDRIDFYGFGVKHAAIKDKLDIGADYGRSRSEGEVSVANGALAPAFPNLSTTLDTLKLYAAYRLQENVTINAGYWYERYDSRNWMVDGLAPLGIPNLIPNFLAFGDAAPHYKINVVRLSMKYRF